MTLVVIFGVCWLPYHIYFILSYTNPQINHSRYIQVGLLFVLTLALFGRHKLLLNNFNFLIISGNLSLNLLAGYVQFDVQPYDLLRHEQ